MSTDIDMEISSAVLVEVGTSLGVGVYARVASAFIASGVDLFSNPHAGVRQPIGLTDEHLALVSKYGDVHTAVKWYFNWCPDQSLPEDHERSFNSLCFRKMHSSLNLCFRKFAHGVTCWEFRLSVAIAFVLPDWLF